MKTAFWTMMVLAIPGAAAAQVVGMTGSSVQNVAPAATVNRAVVPPAAANLVRTPPTQPAAVPSNIDGLDQAPLVSPIQLTPQLAPGTVSNAQVALAATGLYKGPITGTLTGPTRAALRAFQTSASLPATGELDVGTAQRLGLGTQVLSASQGNALATSLQTSSLTSTAPSMRAAQLQLAALGFLARSGVSGLLDPATSQALLAFQGALGLPQTGLLDAATAQALGVGTGLAAIPASSTLSVAPLIIQP